MQRFTHYFEFNLLGFFFAVNCMGNPETNSLLIGFREEQSKASLIGAFMLARGVSRRRKVQIANFLATITLRRMFS